MLSSTTVAKASPCSVIGLPVRTKILVPTPAASAAIISSALSPTITELAMSMFRKSRAERNMPGLGLRQSHSSLYCPMPCSAWCGQ
ncbi:Uncharacterised protein [Vibrio cholerae]|nr:Uncharacterised protein [Vibrio cholerae]